MDYLYYGDDNERIVQGNLPKSLLQKVPSSASKTLDFFERGKDILVYFSRNPAVLYDAINSSLNNVTNADHLLQKNNYDAPFNIIINTAYNPAVLNDDTSAYQEALQLCPVVTDLDKAFWLLISSQAMIINTVEGEEKEYLIEMFFAWLYLFKVVQENECIFGRTLDFTSVSNTSPVLEILWSPWSERNSFCSFVELTPDDLIRIKTLELTRNELKNRIAREISCAATIAQNSEFEWDQFLRVLNYYSTKEAAAVNSILDSLSRTEKLQAIGEYLSILKDNSNDQCVINGEIIDLCPVIEVAKKRLQDAPSHCLVANDSGQVFRLHHYVSELVTFPMTFNLLLLCYHQFRLDPQYDSALLFCNLSLHYLKRNLTFTGEYEYLEAIDEIVDSFCKEFCSFIDANQEHIDHLSFDGIQQDTVFIGNASLNAISTSVFWDHVSDKLKAAFLTSLESGKNTESQICYTKEQFEAQFAEEQVFALSVKPQIVARQAVASLNIVYLFCDVLRIMQSNNQEKFYYSNTPLIENCFSVLKRQMGKLSYSVYTGKADVDKHRLDRGIDASSLSEQEAKIESLASCSFMEIIFDALTEIVQSIGSQDIEGLLQLKLRVIEEIRQCSICNLTAHFSDRFISINEQICGNLIDLCKLASSDFENEKKRIMLSLGEQASKLPETTINALATAELLYKRYASSEFAEKGFDYSCISSLYYQAFEDAYNSLIWHDYAKDLNSLTIDSRPYTNILYDNRDHDDLGITAAKGYLGHTAKSRRFYVDYIYDEHIARVKMNLMYTSFASIIGRVRRESKLTKFSGYFAKIAGFPSSNAMFEDSQYMKELHSFAKNIENAANNRNNASHGGSPVSIVQCEQDKLTVLHKLESVRADSIGLIQKLLYLVKANHSSPHN